GSAGTPGRSSRPTPNRPGISPARSSPTVDGAAALRAASGRGSAPGPAEAPAPGPDRALASGWGMGWDPDPAEARVPGWDPATGRASDTDRAASTKLGCKFLARIGGQHTDKVRLTTDGQGRY